jgi:hypothetical protein
MGYRIVIVFLIVVFAGCVNHARDQERLRQVAEDMAIEARIDTVYPLMTAWCDSLIAQRLPVMVDSVLRLSPPLSDSGALVYQQKYWPDTTMPAGLTKAEKIIRELRWDCYTNLLRETYKTVLRLRQQGSAPSPVLRH